MIFKKGNCLAFSIIAYLFIRWMNKMNCGDKFYIDKLQNNHFEFIYLSYDWQAVELDSSSVETNRNSTSNSSVVLEIVHHNTTRKFHSGVDITDVDCKCRPTANGNQGPQGIQGKPGNDSNCSPDVDGDKGEKGDIGPIGPPGFSGPAGEQGSEGDEGANGTKGDTGNIGPPGTPGEEGDIGPNGTQGPPGPQGPKGDAGRKGMTGQPGFDGINLTVNESMITENQGDDGKPGNIGLLGEEGFPGAPGIVGTKCTNDSMNNCKPGPAGERGVPGMHGPPGPQGSKPTCPASSPSKKPTSKVIQSPSCDKCPDCPSCYKKITGKTDELEISGTSFHFEFAKSEKSSIKNETLDKLKQSLDSKKSRFEKQLMILSLTGDLTVILYSIFLILFVLRREKSSRLVQSLSTTTSIS